MPHDPRSYKPLHPSALIPSTGADFDFGTVIDRALADEPPASGHPGQSFQYFYDAAVQKWLERIFQLAGRTLPVVMAAPSNAFAEYWRILGRTCAPGGDPTEAATPPLPMVSATSSGHRPRAGSNPYPVRNMAFIDDTRSRRATAKYGTTYARYPKPVTIPYRISVWAQYKTHLHWLVQRFEETFFDLFAHFRVASPYHQGCPGLLAAAKRVSADDVSELERGTEERLLRYDFGIEVEAWIFHDSRRAPTVHATALDAADPFMPYLAYEDLSGAAKPRLDQTPGPLEPDTDGV